MLQKFRGKFGDFGAAPSRRAGTKSGQLIIPSAKIVNYEHLIGDQLRAQPAAPIPSEKIIHLDPANLKKYEYHSVPDQGIRLLKVHDEVLQFPDGRTQKKCSLLHCTLHHVPPYVALSYTWGCPIEDPIYMEKYREPKQWILADNGEYFRISSKEVDGIGRNLYEALKILTENNHEPVRLIWIDQLSINQDDLEERASQVSVMDMIYKCCQKVIVWLGEELERDIADFTTLHRKLAPSISYFMMVNDRTALSREDWDHTNVYARLNLDSKDCQFDWHNYYRFFSERRWFRRAWVVQEVAFAQEVRFFCGNNEFILEELAIIPMFFRCTGLSSYYFGSIVDKDDAEPDPWTRILSFSQLQRHLVNFGSEWQKKHAKIYRVPRDCAGHAFFLDCLGILRSKDVSDDRDRIFAALGFLKRGLVFGFSPPLKADYKATVEATYIKTATALLQCLPELTLLSYVEDPSKRRLTNLPSWVPDFTVSSHPLRLGDVADRYNATKGGFDRALGMKTIRIEDKRLWLDGAELGAIAGTQNIVQMPPTWDEEDSFLLYTMVLMQSWFDLLNGVDTTTQYLKVSPLEVLWRTLCLNRLDNPQVPMKPISRQMFHDFMLNQFIGLEVRKHNGALQQVIPPSLEEQYAIGSCWPTPHELKLYTELQIRMEAGDLVLPSQDLEKRMEIDLNTGQFCRVLTRHTGDGPDRRLFTTETGYLGLGPVSLQKGDQVWLFKGGRLPLVLRPVESGCFRLIGETYVHGVMNGEVWGKLKKQRMPVCLI
ncbi:heterokaryon incompatibility protein-domain-containing protein [Paraphoma chrysanthemicola]|nr:heterokaryon incompatibility protein-domain-containing protein [Paraphoma chrysanthemicola]